MLYDAKDSFAKFCYYFLLAPGDFTVRVTGGKYLLPCCFLTVISLSFIPYKLGKKYLRENRPEVESQLRKYYSQETVNKILGKGSGEI